MAAGEEFLGEVAADEARSAGNKTVFHGKPPGVTIGETEPYGPNR